MSLATPARFSNSTRAGGARSSAPNAAGARRPRCSSPSSARKAGSITMRARRAGASCSSFQGGAPPARTAMRRRSPARGSSTNARPATAASIAMNSATRPISSPGTQASRTANWASPTATRARITSPITRATPATGAGAIRATSESSRRPCACRAIAMRIRASSIAAKAT